MLLTISTRKEHKWYRTKRFIKTTGKTTGGYFGTRVCADDSFSTILHRHRAIGLVFINYNDNPLKLVINHLNGVPGDDRVENLEWTTHKGNSEHAIKNGLINRSVKVEFKNNITGEIIKYPNIRTCIRELDLSCRDLYERLRNPHKRYSDGISIKLDDGAPWPSLDKFITPSKSSKDIAAYNVFTKVTTLFNSPAEASRRLNINSVTIINNANSKRALPIKEYIFQYVDEFTPWPVYNEKDLKIFTKYPESVKSSAVVITNMENLETKFYESIELAATAYGILYGTMYERGKEMVTKNNERFSLYSPNKTFKYGTE